MNRRKFLQFIGLAPFAPALAKIAGDGVAIETIAHPTVEYIPLVQRQVYFGPSLVEMIIEQQEKTKQAMIKNLETNFWKDET